MQTPRMLRQNPTLGTGLALLGILGLPLVGGWIAGCQRTPPPAAALPAAPKDDATAPKDEAAAAEEAIQRGDLPDIRTVSAEERRAFLGSDTCVQCHQEQKIQTTSRHARTLARVDPKKFASLFNSKERFPDPENGSIYRPAMKNGRCVIQAKSMGSSYTEEAVAEWAFGSGDLGVTFVGDTNEGPTELRISHFGHANVWDFTPGQRVGSRVRSTLGQTLPRRGQIECFRCHTTALVEEDEKIFLDRSLFGVTCEACHGPGRAHVEAVKRGEKDLRMPRLQNVREHVSLGLCGQCHRSPSKVMSLDNPRVLSQLPRLQGVAIMLPASPATMCIKTRMTRHDRSTTSVACLATLPARKSRSPAHRTPKAIASPAICRPKRWGCPLRRSSAPTGSRCGQRWRKG
jgi:hypothetical protein